MLSEGYEGQAVEGPKRERRGREGSLPRIRGGNPSPFGARAGGLDPPGASDPHRGEVPGNSQRIRGESWAAEGPHEDHQSGAAALGGGLQHGLGSERIHPRPNKGDTSLLNLLQGGSGRAKESLCAGKDLFKHGYLGEKKIKGWRRWAGWDRSC